MRKNYVIERIIFEKLRDLNFQISEILDYDDFLYFEIMFPDDETIKINEFDRLVLDTIYFIKKIIPINKITTKYTNFGTNIIVYL